MAKGRHGGEHGRDGQAPAKPEGWRSACQLSEGHVGGLPGIAARMEKLRAALVGDIVAGLGCSEAKARGLVEACLIGRRKPRRGPESLAASPDAIRLLELTRKDETAPAKPEKWRTAWELSEQYRGGDSKIARRLTELWTELVGDIVAGLGCSEAKARGLVEMCLIGRRKPRRGGVEGQAVSPDAVRLAEWFGKLVRKEREDGHAR